MSPDDLEYYERRAEAEILAAQQSRDPRSVQFHYELATAYLDRLHPAQMKTAAADRGVTR